jgi:eukaryotic-like serine/threonine-protein kinase
MSALPQRMNGQLADGGKPHVIGGCRLLRILGKGGMSEVYLGYDQRHGRPVAVKMIADNLSHDSIQLDRFQLEVVVAKWLNHPNIVRGLDSGRDPATKRRFLVLEYIDGPSAQLLVDRDHRLQVNDAAHIAVGIAKGLAHMHGRGFVHRDIKPDNILLSPCGRAKLIDFGLVKWERKDGEPLTATNDGFGTSYYMPVEQALNAHFVDARSDIFALGATLYHLLTGRVPFPGEDHRDVMRMKEKGVYTPVSLLNPGVPAEFELILNRMLARDPRHRFRSCHELIEALQRARLAQGLPTFADLGQAVRKPDDPARGNGDKVEATRPDLRLRQSNMKRSQNHTGWFVRYRNRRGMWKMRRATTEQLLNALRAKRFPGPVFASRQLDHRFRPLADYPEFHVYFSEPNLAPAMPGAPESPPSSLCRRILARIGLGIF